jgi:LysM repeat protein
MTRSRYAFLFNLKSTDYKGWAKGLKKAGYATNPRYPELLIKLIEDNSLVQYDRMNAVASKTKIRKVTSKPTKQPEVITTAKQEISITNNVNYIIAESGQSYLKIAIANEMALWQIRKYNDLQKGQTPKKGDIIYLQPKRRKSKEHEYHIVKAGQNLYQISQQYGVKLKCLKKYNKIGSDGYVAPGRKIYLRKH